MSEQERFNAVFQTRLRELIKRRGTTITALAKELGISRQAVSQYADGTGQPNIDKLVLIARYFDVSTDYLSGIAEFERVENENVLARDLGLSEQSVNILKFFAGNPEYPSFIQTLNYLIEQETPPPDSFSIGTWDGMTKAEYEKAVSDAEEEFDRSYMKWEQMGYVPILSAVHDFFSVERNSKKYDLLSSGEILKKKSETGFRSISLDAIRTVQASDIMERILLSEIEDRLKKLKERAES